MTKMKSFSRAQGKGRWQVRLEERPQERENGQQETPWAWGNRILEGGEDQEAIFWGLGFE